MKLIVVNGAPARGKDTFVALCREELAQAGFKATAISSVDKVKEAATLLGWDGAKDATGRDFLSDLKDLSTKVYGGPMRYMEEAILSAKHDALFVFIREPEEIRAFVAKWPSAVTVCVSGPPRGMSEATNHADLRVHEYPYDIHVDNSGSIETLRSVARNVLRSTISGYPPAEQTRG